MKRLKTITLKRLPDGRVIVSDESGWAVLLNDRTEVTEVVNRFCCGDGDEHRVNLDALMGGDPVSEIDEIINDVIMIN